MSEAEADETVEEDRGTVVDVEVVILRVVVVVVGLMVVEVVVGAAAVCDFRLHLFVSFPLWSTTGVISFLASPMAPGVVMSFSAWLLAVGVVGM